MASLKCPYCAGAFELKTEGGEGHVECPLCGKSMDITRATGDRLVAKPAEETAWGTDGFGSEKRRAEYGEIKKGDKLGGFRIEEMVGAGAMAVVYRATQLSLDRSVALKILPREFARKPTFVRQFDSETDLLASLNHPSIVSIIDRGREGDTYYFAMEFVHGTTLGELLASGQVEEDFLMRILEQCAEALVYAHSKGIIHRDIKPANIMLNDQGKVKIADFGVAGLVADAAADRSGKKRVMGTRGYMAPEQEISVTRTDERSDIFSFARPAAPRPAQQGESPRGSAHRQSGAEVPGGRPRQTLPDSAGSAGSLARLSPPGRPHAGGVPQLQEREPRQPEDVPALRGRPVGLV